MDISPGPAAFLYFIFFIVSITYFLLWADSPQRQRSQKVPSCPYIILDLYNKVRNLAES